MRRVLGILLFALAFAGCALIDCSFETTEISGFATVRVQADGVGDTLTVVFVQAYERDLRVFTRAGLEPTPSTDGETVTVGYDTDGLEFGDISPPRPPRLASLLQGDTMYVYVEGELSPDLFMEVCSPPQAYLRIDVVEVQAPEAVRAVRIRSVFAEELVPRVADALRQLDAERPRPILFV